MADRMWDHVSKPPRAFDTETQALVDWFVNEARAPEESFDLDPGVWVIEPAKFFRALLADCEAGADGPRARMGALQDDLKKLKIYLDGRAKADKKAR